MKPKNWNSALLRWLPVLLLVLATVVRFAYIGRNDLALDEPFTVFHSQGSLQALFAMLPGENNPPLFFLVMHYWIGLTGISTEAVRILPALFSIMTAMVLYYTGKRHFSLTTGLAAFFLFLFSGYHQLFAHEARVYSLFALLFSLSMYFFLSFLSKPGRKAEAAGLAVTNSLLVYSHFFGFFIFLVQLASIAAVKGDKLRMLKAYAVPAGLSLLSFLPYLPVFLHRFSVAAGQGTWVEPPVLSDLYTMVWRYMNAPVVTVAGLVLLAGGLWMFFVLRRNTRPFPAGNYLVLVTWFFVPYLLMFAVSYLVPMFLDRYTVFISVGFCLLLAASFDLLFRNMNLRLAGTAALAVMMALTFHPDADNRRELKETVNYIRDNKGDSTLVVISPPWLSYGFAYHYDAAIFSDQANFPGRLSEAGIFPVASLAEVDTNIFTGADRVLYFEEWSSLTDPQQTVIAFLGSHYTLAETRQFRESYQVRLYKK